MASSEEGIECLFLMGIDAGGVGLGVAVPPLELICLFCCQVVLLNVTTNIC